MIGNHLTPHVGMGQWYSTGVRQTFASVPFGSKNPKKQNVLKFDSLEKAVFYARKCNVKYITEIPKDVRGVQNLMRVLLYQVSFTVV
jgi:hypothetical protein